jgi:branched-chain amino acid transport system substrate-binding protein
MKRRTFAATGLAVLAFVTAPVSRAQVKEVVIGAVYPLSGPDALTGRSAVEGFRMGIDDVNAAGGIKSLGGAKLRVEFADHGGKPEAGASETERLIQKGFPLIVGSWHSSVTFTASLAAERNRTPFFNPESVADKITERGFKYLFRLVAPTKHYAKTTYEFLDDMMKRTGQKVATVGVMYEDTLYGQSAAADLKQHAEARGLKLVADIAYPKAIRDATAIVARMKSARPDLFLQASYVSDAILIRKTMVEQRFEAKALIGHTINCVTDNYMDGLRELAEYGFCTTGWWEDTRLPGVDVAGISKRFKDRFGISMDDVGSLTYTAAWVIRDVLERAGSLDKEKIREAFTKVDIPFGDPHNLRPNAIRFGPDGQNVHARLIMTQVLQGKVRTVWPTEVASREPIFPAPAPR